MSKTITFYKRGEDGFFLTEGIDYQIRTRLFTATLDHKTQNLYREEPSLQIAKKALMLAFFTLPYTFGTIAVNPVLGISGTKPLPKAAIDMVKAPFFGALLFLSSCYTVVNPLHGRIWIDWTERCWHQVDLKQDIRHGKTKEEFERLTGADFRKEVLQEKKILFAALCMQRLGNCNDTVGSKPKIVILRE